MKKNNLIYTPERKIPIGERVVTETGLPAINVINLGVGTK
jgi:hypothetical protein